MPLDESILDFTNRWYSLVLDSAQQLSVTPAITIRIANAPVFLLTKWDAFGHRGADDPYGSHDLEDIVMLVAGRPELSHEVLELPLDARRFLVNALRDALGSEWFLDVVEGALPDARTLPGLVGLVHGRFTTMLTQLTMKDDTQ
ncbi:MAG TPA: hypothetical protein VE869_14645, partial [Gemmatimonas sp.]|nr:hypothetical protein [Gemmatimonas sp.]